MLLLDVLTELDELETLELEMLDWLELDTLELDSLELELTDELEALLLLDDWLLLLSSSSFLPITYRSNVTFPPLAPNRTFFAVDSMSKASASDSNHIRRPPAFNAPPLATVAAFIHDTGLLGLDGVISNRPAPPVW